MLDHKYGSLGTFAPIKPLFEKTLGLAVFIGNTDLEFASEAKIQRVANLILKIQNELSQIKNFAPQGNVASALNDRMEAYKAFYDQTYDELALALALSRPPTAKLLSEAQEIVSRLNQIVAKTEIDAAELIKKASEVAVKTGIADQADHFKTEATDHARMSKRWLAATILLALLTIAAVSFNYFKTFRALEKLSTPTTQTATEGNKPDAPSSASTSLNIQLAIAKIVGFSFLFSAVVWAGRVYNANRHNYVVNKHRQNALSVFETFVKATKDEQIKNAVLLQATQCIFSPQTTGYTSAEKETDGTPKILEIMRSVPVSKA